MLASREAPRPWLGVSAAIVLWAAAAAVSPATPPTAEVDPEAVKNLEAAYPEPPDGMDRKVILLPKMERDEEGHHRVEIVVGRSIITDGVNVHRFGGELREVSIPGWGFSFWQAEGPFDMPVSTRIAAAADPAARFVAGPSELVSYNSRLPLVVMVPAGCDVRWRVWSAGREFTTATDHPTQNAR
jgi:ecotin